MLESVLQEPMDKPVVFISYSHSDEAWKDRVVTHLQSLEQLGRIETWDDRKIGTGRDWYAEVVKALNAASLAILLVSPDFLASKFIMQTEVPLLFRRKMEQGIRVIPLIVKPCAWKAADWIRTAQAWPTDGVPLSTDDEDRVDQCLSELVLQIQGMLGPGPPSLPGAFVPLPPEQVAPPRLPITGELLVGRESELELLDEAWSNIKIHVITIVAWGGVGKTALVQRWLARMAADNYRGAQRVFDWSFYSQGTRDSASASADQFFDQALRFFGDPDPTQGDPWERGARLARLVANSRTLLVMDGLEPLQHPPGPQEGRLKDPSLQSLVKGLAAFNQGLCIITTREKVADLATYSETTAPTLDLENLSSDLGTQLLKQLNVKGTNTELREASEAFEGHALALTLLGTYLSEFHQGDIRPWREIPLLDDEDPKGRHARRMMQAYENWLGHGPEWFLLRLVGLFDRPARGQEIRALLSFPIIEGLTGTLLELTQTKLNRVKARLRRLRLLGEASLDDPNALDSHPLVREYLSVHLEQDLPDAWKEGHVRLYKCLRQGTERFPDSLKGMQQLFDAVRHGCCAGLHQRAYDEVYYSRIDRGNAFAQRQLGAFGACVSALSWFFERPWGHPVDSLREPYRAWILNEVGYCLRPLGRLHESEEPLDSGLEAYKALGDFMNAARIAGNLSELYLTLGRLPEALQRARQSVELADRSGDTFFRIVMRGTLANALHISGHFSQATLLFRRTEQLQKSFQPQFPLLYSLQGFQFCDLLLGECEALASAPVSLSGSPHINKGQGGTRSQYPPWTGPNVLPFRIKSVSGLRTLATLRIPSSTWR